MSQDFTKVLVVDDRISNITSEVKMAVVKGGANISSQTYLAVSESPSSVTFNIQTPSEQTVISREILWASTVEFAVTGVPAAGAHLIDYGVDTALAPFPLHQLTNTMTATINNNSVSMNTRDILAPLLHFHDKRVLSRYNGSTPTLVDRYKYYADAQATINNPLGGYKNITDNDFIPRGAYPIYDVEGNTVQEAGKTDRKLVKFKVDLTEPIMLSPFLFGNPESNNQGLTGVQNLSFSMSMADAKRSLRTAKDFIDGVTVSFSNSRVILTYLSPHPSSLLPARSVVPYYEIPRYISNNYGEIAAGATSTLVSQSLQLSSIPDKLIVVVRKRLQDQTYQDTDSFFTIKGVSINFNNASGLCSGFTQQDLWKCSVRNDVGQSWLEFTGKASYADEKNGKKVFTTGSVLCLAFGTDIELNSDFYAQGSLGNFNLQLQLQVENTSNDAITPEVVIMTMNSGILVTERGTCQTYLGLLTKQDVLEASRQQPYSRGDVKRMVGGGFFDTLKSVAGKLLPKVLPIARQAMEASEVPLLQTAAKGLKAIGYGKQQQHHRGVEKDRLL